MAEQRHLFVGGGLAGLMTTIKICEGGGKVDLFSVVPVKRSHSVCAQGGINAAVNWKGEGDSPQIHFDDTIYGGDFLANQPPVKAMCEAGPAIIFLLDRMGVPFNRTPEGLLDFRRFGGTKHHRTAFAGATTGQQMLYALDEQVRRYEAQGLVRKFETCEFVLFPNTRPGPPVASMTAAAGNACTVMRRRSSAVMPRQRPGSSMTTEQSSQPSNFRTSPAASCRRTCSSSA